VKKIKLIITAVAFAVSIAGVGVVQTSVFAAPADDVCDGIKATGGTCTGDGGNVDTLVKTIVQIISAVAGIVAVIMIIISGIKYITSGGDSTKITSAKNTLIYAIVGLVIVVLSQFIVHFVVNRATAVDKPPAAPAPK
jgi:type IV secretory pathway VirB2 component (pilin)